MRVQVDETRRDDQALGVDGLRRRPGVLTTELRDASIVDPHIALEAGLPGAVDDGAVPDVKFEVRHCRSPMRV